MDAFIDKSIKHYVEAKENLNKIIKRIEATSQTSLLKLRREFLSILNEREFKFTECYDDLIFELEQYKFKKKAKTIKSDYLSNLEKISNAKILLNGSVTSSNEINKGE